MQEQLNVIVGAYPAIPKIHGLNLRTEDGGGSTFLEVLDWLRDRDMVDLTWWQNTEDLMSGMWIAELV